VKKPPLRKPSRSIAALGAAFFVSASVWLSACGGGGIPGNAVVQVNGTPITKTTFDHWLGVAASSTAAAPGSTSKPVIPDPPTYTNCIAHLQATAPKPAKGAKAPTAAQYKTQCEQEYTALKQQVLGFLISASWVIGEASDQGVSVSDHEVEKKFTELKKQQFPQEAKFQQFLASTGQTVSDLLLRVKLNLLSQKIQTKISKEGSSKKVTQAQIEKYYNENKQRFGQPERRDLVLILTKTQAQAEAAKKEVQSGKSFASVAKAKSIDPASKTTGGSLPGVVKGQEQAALNTAVFSAKTNVLSGPVKTPFGYYVFEVKAIHAASQEPLSQAKESIKQQLAATQQQSALTKFIADFKKKWEGRTECRKEYMVADCKGYKAPAVPTTAVPTTPATPQTSTGTTTSK
jgi:foldase protein PrsA